MLDSGWLKVLFLFVYVLILYETLYGVGGGAEGVYRPHIHAIFTEYTLGVPLALRHRRD